MQHTRGKTTKPSKTKLITPKKTTQNKSRRAIATKVKRATPRAQSRTTQPSNLSLAHNLHLTPVLALQQSQQHGFHTTMTFHLSKTHSPMVSHLNKITRGMSSHRRLFSTESAEPNPTSKSPSGPVFHQQFLKATGSASKDDQAQMERRMASQKLKHEKEIEEARLRKAAKSLASDPQGGDQTVDNQTLEGSNEGNPNESAQVESDDYDAPPTPEELFHDMAPLSADMWHSEPRNHRSTLLWLPDHFETHNVHSHAFNLLQSKQMRVAIPTPPRRECSVVGGEEKNAWYDVHSVPFNPEKADLDFEGLKVSMYQLHQLIRDEAFYLGERLALELHGGDEEKTKAMTDAEIEKMGAERIFLGGFGQGGALATFAGLRYPNKLGGIMAHSGYIPFVDQTIEAAQLLKAKFDDDKQNDPENSPTTFDLSKNVPNIKTPLYVVYNANDQVIPWLALAQPSFIKAVKQPLQCQLILRTGKSTGHSIASGDLFEFQFWQNDLITKLDAEFAIKVKQEQSRDQSQTLI